VLDVCARLLIVLHEKSLEARLPRFKVLLKKCLKRVGLNTFSGTENSR
jgi:hypothetical protein